MREYGNYRYSPVLYLFTYLLLVTCSVVSRTPCRRVVDTSGRGVARHLISVWVVGASSCGQPPVSLLISQQVNWCSSSLGRYVFGSEISYNKAPPRLPGLGC
jgi:hypothetical protein